MSRRFICPASMQPHALEVLRGAYDIPGLRLPDEARVLDIGANVGAFAVWAVKRWPGCKVRCYEPEPGNFDVLCDNVRGLAEEVYLQAVGRRANPSATFYRGANNCGECSKHDLGEQNTEDKFEAEVVDACDVCRAHLLKMDTEGCEIEILQRYFGSGYEPLAIAYEWHRPKDRWELGYILSLREYRCVGDHVRRPDRGICKWVRKDVVLT